MENSFLGYFFLKEIKILHLHVTSDTRAVKNPLSVTIFITKSLLLMFMMSHVYSDHIILGTCESSCHRKNVLKVLCSKLAMAIEPLSNS